MCSFALGICIGFYDGFHCIAGRILLLSLWMCSKRFGELLGPYQWKEAYVLHSHKANFFCLRFYNFQNFKNIYLCILDQRALGMSMRVERASLEQVGSCNISFTFLFLFRLPSLCNSVITKNWIIEANYDLGWVLEHVSSGNKKGECIFLMFCSKKLYLESWFQSKDLK